MKKLIKLTLVKLSKTWTQEAADYAACMGKEDI